VHGNERAARVELDEGIACCLGYLTVGFDLPTDAEKIAGIKAPGRYDTTAASEQHARDLLQQAMPNAIEVPRAIAGLAYPSPPVGCKAWYQLHPPEPVAGNRHPHFKYNDWTVGKKGRGGSWGHVDFPGCVNKLLTGLD
jgi:hypothetical protein